jgi:hypothetical protein
MGEGAVAKGVASRGAAVVADLRDLWDRVCGRPPRPRSFRPNGWTIEEVGRAIRNQPIEWGYVFDPSGKQVVRRRGTKRVVAFDQTELPLLGDATLVHNHPVDDDTPEESHTFSSLDLVFAVRYNLLESHVVAGSWRFVIRRPAAGWPADEEIVLAISNEASDAITRELVVAVAEGRRTESETDAILPHEIIRVVAEWGDIAYLRERMPWL